MKLVVKRREVADSVYEIFAGRLWQAGWKDGDLAALADDLAVDGVISMVHPESSLPGLGLLLVYPIDDELYLPDDMATLVEIAALGAGWVTRGGRLAVFCWGGFNRSGLMCGMVLSKLGYGPGSAIVERIQQANAEALNNVVFRRYVERLP